MLFYKNYQKDKNDVKHPTDESSRGLKEEKEKTKIYKIFNIVWFEIQIKVY